jgi:hypothetical protein
MAYQGDHPPLGQSHPWTSPLASPDLLNPRPDWAFAAAGALSPIPEDFPFTEGGKQEFYAAVVRVAHNQLARVAAERALAARRAEEAAFLLLAASGSSMAVACGARAVESP